jgi:ATP-dependent DNA ligase
LASYKLDGVRCLIYIKDGEVHTASRGGQDYDIPATYIRKDPYLVKVLSERNIILDGEIYRHGWPLSKISGLCRKETLEKEHKELEFRCYDILDEGSKFKFRAITLGQLKQDRPDNSKLVIVNHIPVSGLDNIMQLHNKAVSEGYEGLVLRDPDKEYKCGSRDNRMCKVKEFSDSEFKILGLVEGLRDEDMCFLLETSDGNQFKAKPMGTREDKQWYRDHINELIGKLGTVKYFGFTNTENPVPNLPVFKCVRTSEDL